MIKKGSHIRAVVLTKKVFLNTLIHSYISRGIYIYIHTGKSAVYTTSEIKAGEFSFSLTIRHIGTLRSLFVCSRGLGDTANALIWEWWGAGLSRGRRDADGERGSVGANEEEERVFIWNGPWEGSDLIIFGYRDRARVRDPKREWRLEGEGGREGMWRRDKGGLVFISTITNCHCCHLPPPPLCSPSSLFLHSFLSPFPLGCTSYLSRLQTL